MVRTANRPLAQVRRRLYEKNKFVAENPKISTLQNLKKRKEKLLAKSDTRKLQFLLPHQTILYF